MVSLAEDLRLALDRSAFARQVGLELDPWQDNLLRSTSDGVLLNCCRQSGKSTMSALVALHQALYRPGSLVLILAPAERQAKETFSKVAEMYATLGERVAPDSYRKLGMELQNRSRIEALPGTEKTIRGFSGVDLLIVDEASRVDDGLYYDLIAMTPRLIDELPSEEKLRVYEMLGLRVTSGEDGTLKITGDLAGLSFGKSEPSYPSRF